eukprot:TRINITY_DN33760_c0_g1_i1.p1 TRINITY_DN33760_c0_g1~~TRINITY_DN33760_c0_g1_i1.p1  ORF type:complete len:122 (-),score=2.87 TRINITY_DN33760_c0_g1_i1:165-530(-)
MPSILIIKVSIGFSSVSFTLLAPSLQAARWSSAVSHGHGQSDYYLPSPSASSCSYEHRFTYVFFYQHLAFFRIMFLALLQPSFFHSMHVFMCSCVFIICAWSIIIGTNGGGYCGGDGDASN